MAMSRDEDFKRLLNIDLNALPEDDDNAGLESECCSDFNAIAVEEGVVDADGSSKPDLSVRNCEKNMNKTLSHCVQVKDSEIDVTEGEKGDGVVKIDSNRIWKALLDATEIALDEYEEEESTEFRTRKVSRNRRTSRESDELRNWSTKKRRIVCSGGEVVAPPVVRSTRGRTVALPNKYKDSFLGPVAASEFPRRSRNGKSATAAAYRKSR